MQNEVIPLYLNWSFWAVVIAFIALLLSQLPPIHKFFKRPKLDLELYSKISLTHHLGNPNLQLHLILNNIGGWRVRVKDINVSISRDGSHLVDLPSQSYLQNQNDVNSILLTSFALDPNSEWAHTTNFLKFFSREDQKTYQTIDGNLRTDFRSYQKSHRVKADPESDDLYEHPSELVEPVHDFFNKHFCWKPGEYHMTVNVIANSKSANITNNYRFTIFESHTDTLESIKDYFKYGGSIYWNPKIQTNVILELSEA